MNASFKIYHTIKNSLFNYLVTFIDNFMKNVTLYVMHIQAWYTLPIQQYYTHNELQYTQYTLHTSY